MEKKPNRRCRVCGTWYYACESCADKQRRTYGLEPWRAVAESPVHYQIYMLLISYTRQEETAWAVKQQMERLDLSDLETFTPQNQELIREILNAENPEQEQDHIAEDVRKVARPSRKKKRAASDNAKDGVADAVGE